MIWGFVYLVPEVLPGYPPALMAAGRFVSFGLVALPLAWMERRVQRLVHRLQARRRGQHRLLLVPH